MAILTVGPTSTYPTIAIAMANADPGDTISLEAGYSNESATITFSGMIVTGEASSLNIELTLGAGVSTFSLAGTAPINVFDSPDGNAIVGNGGDNVVTVTAGADAVFGGGAPIGSSWTTAWPPGPSRATRPPTSPKPAAEGGRSPSTGASSISPY